MGEMPVSGETVVSYSALVITVMRNIKLRADRVHSNRCRGYEILENVIVVPVAGEPQVTAATEDDLETILGMTV